MGATSNGVGAAMLRAALAATLVGGCGATSTHPGGLDRAAAVPRASTEQTASPEQAPAPAWTAADAARQPIAAARSMELPFAVMPTLDEGAVLLVHQDLLRGYGLVRLIHPDAGMSPVHAVVGRFVAGGRGGGGSLLITTDGQQLCTEPLQGPTRDRHCLPLRPRSLVALADELWWVGERLQQDESSEEESSGKGTTKKRSSADSAPQRLDIWTQRLDVAGRATEDLQETGLAFARPMPGMGLIDATATRDGVRLIWYEHAPTVRRAGKRERRARLRTGRLDAEGAYLPTSRSTLFEGERMYGFVDGHMHPRLFGRAGRVAYLGRFVDDRGRKRTTGFEGIRLRPRRTVDVPTALAGVDPFRLADGRQLATEEMALLERVWDLHPVLSTGQPRWEAEHVAWTASRGYFIADGKLRAIDRADGVLHSEPAPFAAERSRIHWTAFSRSGAGVAQVSGGYATIDPNGRVAPAPASASSAGANGARGQGYDVPTPRAVRIGDGWWALQATGGTGAPSSGYQVARLLPSAAEATGLPPGPHPDAWVLVGGAQRGTVLARRGSGPSQRALELWQLDATGTASRLSVLRCPFEAEFDAVERQAGGVIAAGRVDAEAGAALVLAIDDGGQVVAQTAAAVHGNASDGRIELRSLPAGGALLTTTAHRQVAWLDDDGRVIAARPWPAEHSEALCVDGRPAPRWVPTPRPGVIVRVDALASPGACLVGREQWAPDGSLRWFGSTADGLACRAEVGLLRADQLASAPPAPPAGRPPRRRGGATAESESSGTKPPAVEPITPQRAPCPPDMVSVAGSVCVDRFESRLTDAATGAPLSPDYPATPKLAAITFSRWVRGRWRQGDVHAQALPLPPLGRAHHSAPLFVARSRQGVRPSGYLTGIAAEQACQRAGKRLCRLEEFVRACRGQEDRKFPYGASYVQGACNVYRYDHPAHELHGNAATGHLDPRLNRVTVRGEALLRLTGSTPRCRSRWGDDAIYDMVGNLDEWVADKKGTFAGGFYSRTTRAGCEAVVTAHPRRYLDYSLGVRCCLEPYRWEKARSR